MKGSEFVFDYVHLLYYKCHKINLDCGRSYVGSPERIKLKKATINPTNKNKNKCFQIRINSRIKSWRNRKNSERIANIKPMNITGKE